MAFIGTGNYPPSPRAFAAVLRGSVRHWLFDTGEVSRATRRAGSAFLIRAAGAVLAYGSNVLFALWMGAFEFGVFVYVWTWVMLLTGFIDVGLCAASQRFIPEYTQRKDAGRLRGFLAGSRWLTLGISSATAIVAALAVTLLQPWLNDYERIPLYLACLALPACGLLNVQTGIARAYNWIQLALLPAFVVRQILVIGFLAIAYYAAFRTDAVTAVLVSTASVWIIVVGQFLILNRRLAAKVEPGPVDYQVKSWLRVSTPMLMVDGFYLLLTYSGVLILQVFHPPHDIAVYYAAEKTLALVAFVHYAVTQTTAHRFSHYDVAGDREKLAAVLAHATRLTFWPSLAATVFVLAAGMPLLALFGADFTVGYPLMFIFATGLLARAAVGPLAAFINMTGSQRACATIIGAAFVTNVALCFILIPWFGLAGAAISISAAVMFESAALFIFAKRRLGIHGFVWGAPKHTEAA